MEKILNKALERKFCFDFNLSSNYVLHADSALGYLEPVTYVIDDNRINRRPNQNTKSSKAVVPNHFWPGPLLLCWKASGATKKFVKFSRYNIHERTKTS